MKYILLATTATALFSITVSAAKVKDTKFKFGRGFFDAPFNEVITTETSGATIIYTLDGSDPRYSENTISGTSPLAVAIDPDSIIKRPKTPGVIVRAYAQKGENIVRASCVGCGICSAVCPRGVLKLENAATDNRINSREVQQAYRRSRVTTQVSLGLPGPVAPPPLVRAAALGAPRL